MFKSFESASGWPFRIAISGLMLFVFQGCQFLFNATVNDNKCKRCEVINGKTGKSVWSDEGCGGGMTNIERDAKARAYEKNAKEHFFQYEVSCETWVDTVAENSGEKEFHEGPRE